MDEIPHIAAAVQFLLRAIVEHPEELIVSVCEGEGTSVLFDVKSSPHDVGKIIGVHGRTARAFRTVLTSISGRLDRRITLNINEASDSFGDLNK